MSEELSNEAKLLVQEGQLALRPNVADRQRVLAALQLRIQHDAPSESAAPSARADSQAGQSPKPDDRAAAVTEPKVRGLDAAKLGKLALVAGGLIASFAAVYQYLSRVHYEAAEAPTFVSESPSHTLPDTLPEAETSGFESRVPFESTPSVSTARAVFDRSPAGDNLAAEAALLSQAEKALHAGNLARALLLTSEHRNKFPKGLMVQERVNIRVQSLCRLGREEDADKEYTRFRRLSNWQPGQACRR